MLFIQTTTEQTLPPDIVDGLKQLLHDHTNTFAKSSADLGFCDILRHDIDTGDSPPIKQPPRMPPLAAAAAEDEILEEMLSTGVIEPFHSPWASPVCLDRNKEGTYRFCVDYGTVNAVSRKDVFPVPDIHDALGHLKRAKYFATFDLLSGYWHLGLTERAKERREDSSILPECPLAWPGHHRHFADSCQFPQGSSLGNLFVLFR